MLRNSDRSGVEVRAPAKLNLSLRVVGTRPDGYHLIDSVVVPIDLYDRLRIDVAPSRRPRVEFRASGLGPKVPEADNLAVRAARLFLGELGRSVRVRMELHKEIPIGAGLGGGSSDAAAVLVSLRKLLCGSALSDEHLLRMALRLGADVPFFVGSRPARLTGIGENVTPLASWPVWNLVVAFPGIAVATPDVYSRYDAALTKSTGKSIVDVSVSQGARLQEQLLVNDLEDAALSIFPSLHMIKGRLLEQGARAAVMTGSGSAVFGVWESALDAKSAARRINDQGIWARAVSILRRRPKLMMRNVGRSPSW